jgi:arginine decarboxylase
MSMSGQPWFDTTLVSLSSGAAYGRQELNAFDYALRDAGIADFNLIKVTSIIPPGIPVRRIKSGATPVLGEGDLAPTIYAHAVTSDPGVTVAAAVGVGVPRSSRPEAGLVYVWSGVGTKSDAEEEIHLMVEDGMKVRSRESFDVSLVSAEAVGRDDGRVACALACALFMNAHIERRFRPSDLVSE